MAEVVEVQPSRSFSLLLVNALAMVGQKTPGVGYP